MTCCGAAVASDAALACDGLAQDRIEEESLRASSHQIDGHTWQTDFIVPDMHCVACIGTIERGLSKLCQVDKVRANLSNRTVSVTWSDEGGLGAVISRQLGKLGFDHTLRDETPDEDAAIAERGRRLLTSLAVAGFAAANIMLLSVSVWSGATAETAQLFHLISGLIAVPAVAYAGQPFFSSARQALGAKRLNMDVPISLAVIMALGMGVFESVSGGEEAYFDAAVTLLFFLLIGRYLDHLMREKARGAVQRLARLSAKGAIFVDDTGDTRYMPLKEIEAGMVLRIRPGERMPVDGEIISGTTDVDRSLVTGESDSISSSAGDRLEAGALNLTGSIDVRATSTAQDSFLAEILKMMNAAENGRSRYVRIADRMAQIYAPAVHILAFVTFIGWMIWSGGDWHMSIYTAIAVLIITCPCALGLAVPVVHVIGANRLFSQGVLIRDGSAFERLSEIDTVIFDKTGTLTMGSPVVVDAEKMSKSDTRLIRTLAARSSHPAAQAVAAYFDYETERAGFEVIEVPGFGVEAIADGKRARLGRPEWVLEIAKSGEKFTDGSQVAFAIEDKPMAIFHIEDTDRPGAAAAVSQLAGEGQRIEIVSGDRTEAVARIAGSLGIDQFMAEATPTDKIQHVTQLQQAGRQVCMIGDGLNDAPALAAGHVSMAPSTASDVGRMAADFVFTRSSLTAVSFSWRVAKATGRLVRQNFAIAIAYNCIAVPLAMTGHVTPLIAAIAMSASSIAVISNSMRLNWLVGGWSGFGVGSSDSKKDNRPTSGTVREVTA